MLITYCLSFSDYRHSSADKPCLTAPQSLNRGPADLNAIHPSLQRHHTAHLRGRHGIVNYDNSIEIAPKKDQPKFWTLPKRTPEQTQQPTSDQGYFNYPPKTAFLESHTLPHRHSQPMEESIKVSPIDPRASGSFKSSTPSNKDNVLDLGSRLLSPVKSMMTNEELYAVIHKSKKRLNIKDNAERAESPALSTISLSPVNSESSLYIKGSQRYPETGYLGEPRNRISWSPADKLGYPTHVPTSPYSTQKQETTCADRYGPVPQTSRLDFKKLLLQHSVKLNTLSPQAKSTKLSAVEQLKISKEKIQNPAPQQTSTNKSKINLLDLSGSPKTYAQRKIIKPNPQTASPGRTAALIKEHKNTPKILLSPKSQWRFSSPRSDVLSSPIPEAYNEDENSNSSGEKHDSSPNNQSSKTVPIVTNQHFGARRNLIPLTENILEMNSDATESANHGVFPLGADLTKSYSLSRTEILQAKRAEFFNTSPDASPPKLTSFKSLSPAGQATNSRSKHSPERKGGQISPSTLETAL